MEYEIITTLETFIEVLKGKKPMFHDVGGKKYVLDRIVIYRMSLGEIVMMIKDERIFFFKALIKIKEDNIM